jgi:hypothetical protein
MEQLSLPFDGTDGETGQELYQQAQMLGLTTKDRWGEGIDHHPKSIQLMKFIAEHDFRDFGDYFSWSIGGDGDNGESLMYQMDAFFELLDIKNQKT